jgi:hypothetical protein
VYIRKPKPIKGTKVIYDGKTYKNIISFSRGYDYGSFSFLDENGSECCVYLSKNNDFKIIEE